MELPKNITQVGETDRNCKIYVEDYVVSYMRQMNKFAEDKEMAIALFGKMSVEQQITYCFVYGACMVQSISREVRHLSQAQNQEIERMRKKYFPEQDFLGYQILNGEMIEGFRIYDQNSCRYVKGYACFFEKNDTMLAYMLEARLEEAQPEKVDQDKYDMVRRRQEERRAGLEERRSGKKALEETAKKEEDKEKTTKFKVVPFVVAAAGCLALLTWFGNDNMQENVTGRLVAWISDIADTGLGENGEEIQEPIIIVGEEQTQESTQELQAVMSTLVTEDKLADAILEENENAADVQDAAGTETSGDAQGQGTEPTVSTAPAPIETLPPVEQTTPGEPTVSVESPAPENLQPEASEAPLQTQAPQESSQPSEGAVQRMESYVIQQGDTLIAISTRIYGNDAAVPQICALNNISNPDNIQIGQKILLP